MYLKIQVWQFNWMVKKMQEHKRPTQNQRILEYLATHDGITHLEAETHLGVMRLASRIADLKKQGYVFSDEMVKCKNRYGEPCRVKRYRLESCDIAEPPQAQWKDKMMKTFLGGE